MQNNSGIIHIFARHTDCMSVHTCISLYIVSVFFLYGVQRISFTISSNAIYDVIIFVALLVFSSCSITL